MFSSIMAPLSTSAASESGLEKQTVFGGRHDHTLLMNPGTIQSTVIPTIRATVL
jgi:hypothetical protein